MRTFITCLCCACLLLFSPETQGADFTSRFERLSIEHGLSQNTVTAILKDHQGFMWFGTRDGLNRFDGYQFRIFRHQPQQPGSISDNYIWALFEDEQGVLWVGTANGGLNRYDRATESFSAFLPDASDPDSLSDIGVRSIYQDGQGALWIGTNAGGLNRFDRQSGRFKHWRARQNDLDSLSNNRIYAMTQGGEGYLWLATAGGVNRFDIKREIFNRYVHQADLPGSLSHNRVRAVLKDKRGRLWFGTDGGGLNRLDITTGRFEHFVQDKSVLDSLSSDFVMSLVEHNSDQLWVGTWGGGLNRFDIATGRFHALDNDPSNSNSLSEDLVYALFKDKKGVLWVGTSGGGVNKFDTRTVNFGHIRHEQVKPGSLSDNNVRAILIDSAGTLWVGTRGGGLNRLDKGKKGFVRYSHDPAVSGSLSNGQIYTLFEDSSGGLWVGTAQGLNRFEPETDSFVAFTHDPKQNSISDNRIKAIAEQPPGTLWVATHGGGLNRFDINTGQFEVFRHQTQHPGSLSHDILTDLLIDSKGTLWVATLGGGLNRFDRQARQFTHFRHLKDDPGSISHDRVLTLLEDSQGRLWAGTAWGLNRMSDKAGVFERFTEAQGLANNVVLAMLEDNLGRLWISSNQGLSRFDIEKNRFKTFDANDGLQSNEFNLNAACGSHQGELLFGGINGLNRFYAERIVEDSSEPPVHLTGFLLSNQKVSIATPNAEFYLSESIDLLKQLVLTHKQTLVTFEFSALDYANPMKNRYAYRLEGWDEHWIHTDATRRLASYTKLSPGDYVFKVKASNKDGFWNESGKQLMIKVLPPWYKTWQAYLLYCLLVLSGGIGFFRYRTRALVQRSELLEQKVKMRTETINQLMVQKHRMFANVSHEFKTPLTLLLNPLQSIIQDPKAEPFAKKLAMMRANGQRLLHMVEQLLELSKLEVRQSRQQYHYYALSDTLKALLTSYQPLFEAKKLHLEYQPCHDILLNLTEDSLEMILGNLLSNALKYTPEGGRIVVMVKADEHKVLIVISDSGIGISLEDQQNIFERFTRVNDAHQGAIPGAGIGLALVKELVEVNRGSIGVVSEPGNGSAFTVTLPRCTEKNVKLSQFRGASSETLLQVALNDEARGPVKEKVVETSVSDALPAVLLIDDNADMLELLKDTLKGRFHCLCAAHGEQGLSVAFEALPDVVICDVMMPGLSGFDVLKQLKASELTDHIPVILLTAKGDMESRLKGWQEKADEYLDKPFNAEELLSRIDNLLGIRNILRKRFQGSLNKKTLKADIGKIRAKVSQPKQPDEQEQHHNGNQVFFDKVYGLLEAHYAEETLDVAFLADKLAMSQRQLGRKMKAVLDYTPTELIRVFRLKKAAELLRQGETPGAVAFKVGFSSHSYFSQCFKAQFDCLPSSYH